MAILRQEMRCSQLWRTLYNFLDVRECDLGDKGDRMNGRTPLLAAVAICYKASTTFTSKYKTFDPVKS